MSQQQIHERQGLGLIILAKLRPFLQIAPDFNVLVSAEIKANPASILPLSLIQQAFKALLSLACGAVQSSGPKGPRHSCCSQCRNQDLVTPASSLTWTPPKKNFDLNILLLSYQALSGSRLSLRRFQISVLMWTCLQ